MTVFRSAYVACKHSLGGLFTPRELLVDLGLVRDSMLAEHLTSLEGFLRVDDAGVHDLHVPDAWLFPDTLLIFLDELCRSLAVHEETRERICQLTLGVYHRWPDDNTRAIARVFARHLLFTAYDRHEVELGEVPADVFDRYPTVPELSAVLPPVHADRAAA